MLTYKSTGLQYLSHHLDGTSSVEFNANDEMRAANTERVD